MECVGDMKVHMIPLQWPMCFDHVVFFVVVVDKFDLRTRHFCFGIADARAGQFDVPVVSSAGVNVGHLGLLLHLRGVDYHDGEYPVRCCGARGSGREGEREVGVRADV